MGYLAKNNLMKKQYMLVLAISMLSIPSLIAQREFRRSSRNQPLQHFTAKVSIGSGIGNLNAFRYSFGSGPNANASLMYRFNKYVGAEVGGTYSFPADMDKPALDLFDMTITRVHARHSAAFVNAVLILNGGHRSNFLFRMGICRGLQSSVTESAPFTYQQGNTVYEGTAIRNVKTQNKLGFCTSAGYSYEVAKGLRLSLDMNIVFLHAPYVSSSMNSFLVNGAEKISVLNTREKEIIYNAHPRTDNSNPSLPTEQESVKAHLGYISLALGLSYSF